MSSSSAQVSGRWEEEEQEHTHQSNLQLEGTLPPAAIHRCPCLCFQKGTFKMETLNLNHFEWN